MRRMSGAPERQPRGRRPHDVAPIITHVRSSEGGFQYFPPHGWPATLVASVMRWGRFERTAENFAGRIPSMLREAGFDPVHEVFHTAWSITCLEAWKGQPTLGNGDWATQKPM